MTTYVHPLKLFFALSLQLQEGSLVLWKEAKQEHLNKNTQTNSDASPIYY